MTNDFIKEKLKEIEKAKSNAEEAIKDLAHEHERIVAEHNALCGAEQAYKEMLAELERAKTEEAKK